MPSTPSNPTKADLIGMFRAAQNQADQAAKAPSANEVAKRAVLDTLDQLGGLTVQDDALEFRGAKFILPEQMEGRVPDAIKYLEDYQEQQEESYEYSRTFKYRPWDGAAAFDHAMKRLFGTTGLGKSFWGGPFVGMVKPEFITIDVKHNETTQVPWNRVHFEPLEADFYLGSTRNRELGNLFTLNVEAPRKHRRRIEAFFQELEAELKANSIYRGKVITGAKDPGFLDTSLVDPNKVVYSDEVMTQLDASLWSLLRYSDRMRAMKMPLKRSVLLEGPYGTGKTLAGMLTAQQAEANGWTFILCRPGQDDLFECLRTAQLYAPAVVQFEDIDVIAGQGTKADVSAVLDALDGISNKGVDVVALFTTNNVENLHRGVLRPGRLDAVIHIGELDRAGVEKLIKVVVPAPLLGDHIDYDAVYAAFTGYLPAFAREAIDRAMRYSLVRTNGAGDRIETKDLVDAANGLRPQLELMTGAGDVPATDNLTQVLGVVAQDAVSKVINATRVVDSDGDQVRGESLAVSLNGKH